MIEFNYSLLLAAMINSGFFMLIIPKIYKICFPEDIIPDYAYRAKIYYYPIGAGVVMGVALIYICIMIATDKIEWFLSNMALLLLLFLAFHILVFSICFIGNLRKAKSKRISTENKYSKKDRNKRDYGDKASIIIMLIAYAFVNFLMLNSFLEKIILQIAAQNIGFSYYIRMIAIHFFACLVSIGLTTWLFLLDKQIGKYDKVKVILCDGKDLEFPFSQMKKTKEMLIFEKAEPAGVPIQQKKYSKIEIPLSTVQMIVCEGGE